MEIIHNGLAMFSPYIGRLNLPSMLFLAFLLLLFICIFILGIMLRKNGRLGTIIILVAVLIPLASPFLLELVSKKIFYPISIEVASKKLQYTPTYFIDANITNIGKLQTKSCILTTTLQVPPKNIKERLQGLLKPLIKNQKLIDTPLKSGESIHIQHTIDNIEQESLNAIIEIDCY
ncbi:hypothetical protein CCZ01_05915 [Helicobacter monodelphidis]|uniref:DUF2393 family protein n=1 Tax=Helicobacter sp. 15-1451 TaxID=2004995 RepID=UPI000DCE708F|nr:DUF2393 family protein [Helicobacter sp. 15-1451]RAX57516.1 hypothetical protein CCZ01_05915 [Helicobacter sp. 15-1451]